MAPQCKKRKMVLPRGRPSKSKIRDQHISSARKASQSHSLKRALMRRIKNTLERLKNRPGSTWSWERSRMTLVSILVGMRDGLTLTQAVEHTMITHDNFNRQMHFDVYNHWLTTDEVLDPDEKVLPRGAAAPSHPLNINNLSLVHMRSIEIIIAGMYASGKQVTLRDIRNHMQCVHGVKVSKELIRRMLRLKGFRWRHVPHITPDVAFELQRARMFEYLRRYSRAMNDENAVFVYIDESYVHQYHHANYGWFHSDPSQPGGTITLRESRGHRFIILHAMTKDGLLHNANHPSVLALTSKTRGDPFHPCATAECIMRDSVSDEGDYHDTMNSDVFMAWVERRLIPSFQVMYPGKRMVLVLDNARYHHARTNENETPVGQMTKDELAEFLVDVGITSLTVKRNNRRYVINQIMWTEHARSKVIICPTRQELLEAVKEWIKWLPDEFKPHSRLRALMETYGYELLFTPPYTFSAQPIERLWSYVKSHVAHMHHKDRTEEELIAHTLQGFYGAPDDSLVDHYHANLVCHKFVQCVHNFYESSLRSYGSKVTDLMKFHESPEALNPEVAGVVDADAEAEQDIDDHELAQIQAVDA